jgi:hypothetical protein
VKPTEEEILRRPLDTLKEKGWGDAVEARLKALSEPR